MLMTGRQQAAQAAFSAQAAQLARHVGPARGLSTTKSAPSPGQGARPGPTWRMNGLRLLAISPRSLVSLPMAGPCCRCPESVSAPLPDALCSSDAA